jgi:hypothetical protein
MASLHEADIVMVPSVGDLLRDNQGENPRQSG